MSSFRRLPPAAWSELIRRFQTYRKVMVDDVEHNYRTDEQLQSVLGRSGECAPISFLEQIMSLTAKVQSAIELMDDPAKSEQLRKIIAGFDVPPIKEPALTAHSSMPRQPHHKNRSEIRQSLGRSGREPPTGGREHMI
jgi:hypothetical protein